MPNQLSNEDSLYLRQHADNPVDWFPWGEEAFGAAQREEKPVLVSIGYSSCHWCHVMAHECFEDDYIAGLMNTHFINIKVDREEHPAVDQVYMEAVQMITQHGGWPLNVFCFPDGRPFFGGTYFPPRDKGNGLVPWPQVLMRVADFYKKKRHELEENADAITKNMLHAENSIAGDSAKGDWNPEFLTVAAQGICQQHDDVNGGFGQAPKFPQAMTLEFLLQFLNTGRAESDAALHSRLEAVLTRSLQAMGFGGIYDQIGGGFSRYSVDSHWLIPHFEKMLYDNGLLLDLYAKAWMQFRDPLYRDIVRETLNWMDREMTGENGLLYSSLDADSEGREGKFYVWSPDEIRDALGDREEVADDFIRTYGISNEGNFEHGTSQPALLSGDREMRDRLKTARDDLYKVRSRRVWPQQDTKQILSWNALAIRGRIESHFAMGDLERLSLEGERLEWIMTRMRTPGGDGLYAIHYPVSGPSKPATLTDYALLLEALLSYAAKVDLVHPGQFSHWLQYSRESAGMILRKFRDRQQPGFHLTGETEDPLLFARRKEWIDSATPSGNSSLLHGFSTLHVLTGEAVYEEEFLRLRKTITSIASRLPTGVSHALSALVQEAVGISTVKAASGEALHALYPLLRQRPWRRLFLQISREDLGGHSYQLCSGTQCLPPENDPEKIAEKIGRGQSKIS